MSGAPITFAGVARLLAERSWRPFPGRQESKTPAMPRWPGLNAAPWDETDLAATIGDYQPDDAYCCCLAVQKELAVLDMDILDPVHAAVASDLAVEVLGKTPLLRIGLAPKHVRVYRSNGGIQSRKLHPLEIFSGSGQVVGFGWHAMAGRPYIWPQASPLDLAADSDEIPIVSPAQLDRFTHELFKLIPRRGTTHRADGRHHGGGPQTIGDRLRMLTTLHGSWKRAAAIVLEEAVEGCRNETGWIVVASAAGRGVAEHVVWRLFEEHFTGWEGFNEDALAQAIARKYSASQPIPMLFTREQLLGGFNDK